MHLCRLLIISLIFVFAACKKPIEHPENVDLIVIDLHKEIATLKTAIAGQEKDIVAKKETIAKAPIRTGEKEMAQDSYFAAQKKLRSTEERLRYWNIRLEQRKKEAREKYPAAFEKDLPWPNHEEFEEYQIEKRLRDIPREWSPERRIRDYKKTIAPKPAAAAPSGH